MITCGEGVGVSFGLVGLMVGATTPSILIVASKKSPAMSLFSPSTDTWVPASVILVVPPVLSLSSVEWQ